MIQYVKSGLLLAVLVTLCACTALKDTSTQNTRSLSVAAKYFAAADSNSLTKNISCLAALIRLDQLAFQYAGTLVGNRLPAKPWLRHNRLITSDIKTQGNAKNTSKLLRRMSSLAKRGLSSELAAVPETAIKKWRQQYQINISTNRFVIQCSAQLLTRQLVSPELTLTFLKAIPPDNDYSRLARIAGLYPLATIPFRLGVIKEQKQLAKEWGQVNSKRWYKYKPKLASSSKSISKSWRLLERHAPVWLVESKTRANLPGSPFWQAEVLEVNTKRPVTYSFVSEARWKQQPVTQLNYVIWFSERPHLKRLDWVAGKHDAVVFRINLDQQGHVIAYDSIHLCGCWYRLFLPKGRPFKRNDRYWREPVLMQRVPLAVGPNQRMAVYLQANTHQIQYLTPVADVANESHKVINAKNYNLAPFSTLLKLPSDGGARSVFNQNGYISGSERPERWLFWPMGVKNPGALRRFGDHAISFVGRRYFDDPHLLEKVSGLRP